MWYVRGHPHDGDECTSQCIQVLWFHWKGCYPATITSTLSITSFIFGVRLSANVCTTGSATIPQMSLLRPPSAPPTTDAMNEFTPSIQRQNEQSFDAQKHPITSKYVSKIAINVGNNTKQPLHCHITRMTSALFAIQNVGKRLTTARMANLSKLKKNKKRTKMYNKRS